MMEIIMESLWFQVPALLGIGLFVVSIAWEVLAFMLRFLLAADKPNAPEKFKAPYIYNGDCDTVAASCFVFCIGFPAVGAGLHTSQWLVMLAPFEFGIGAIITVIVLSIRFLFGAMYDHNDRLVKVEVTTGTDNNMEDISWYKGMSLSMWNELYLKGEISFQTLEKLINERGTK